MPLPRRNENRIAGPDFTDFAVDLHRRAAFKDEIELFAEPVVVAVRRDAGLEGGFGEALLHDRGIGQVEEAPYRRPVGGGEGNLFR